MISFGLFQCFRNPLQKRPPKPTRRPHAAQGTPIQRGSHGLQQSLHHIHRERRLPARQTLHFWKNSKGSPRVMGVDFENCKNCGEIYADCSDYGSCEGCGVCWCPVCKRNGRVEQFFFDGESRCSFCWEDEPADVDTHDLLQFVLDKFGAKFNDVLKEFRASAQDPSYRQGKDCYYCTECECGECASRDCECVSWDTNVPDRIPTRGLCCKARGDVDRCEACVNWEINRARVLMLGMSRFRPQSMLAMLPRDVLVRVLLPLVARAIIDDQ